MRYRLVFLDLDGTLVDSGADIAASLNAAFQAEGLPERPERIIIDAIGGGLPVLVERTAGSAPAEKKQAVLRRVIAHYGEHLLDRTTLFPGVRETLEALRAVKVVVTNKPEAHTRKLLEGLNVAHLFDRLYGGDTLPVRKPDPAALLDGMARYGVAPADALMVGDSGVDIETAAKAGVDSCAVTYGYSKPGELTGAKYCVQKFSEIRDLIAGS
ncbi:MAG: HAD-IA family hydrolase [Planctomycetes bacterium]|nr:HAD-IA family hydrolase [Planctomycetota bacterium]